MDLSFIVLIIIFIVFFAIISQQSPPKKTKTQFYQEQENRVTQGGYAKQALLNGTEKRAYKAILDARGNHKIRVFAQVNLGEVLTHTDVRLYRDINSKRLDFLVTDKSFMPLLAIEIHGTGHYNANHTNLRDSIKQKALKDAGIEYIAIHTNYHNAYRDVYDKFQTWMNNYNSINDFNKT